MHGPGHTEIAWASHRRALPSEAMLQNQVDNSDQVHGRIVGSYRLVPDPFRSAVHVDCIQIDPRCKTKKKFRQAFSQPTVFQLLQALCQPEIELLSWSEEDKRVHPQAAVLGAPLEASKDLHPELQEI